MEPLTTYAVDTLLYFRLVPAGAVSNMTSPTEIASEITRAFFNLDLDPAERAELDKLINAMQSEGASDADIIRAGRRLIGIQTERPQNERLRT
jgi:hypothetical protein